MSEIDRVFARLGGSQPASGEQRELRSIPRKGSSTGSRTVEVVRVASGGPASGRAGPRRTEHRVRAETWDEGFPARATAPSLPTSPAPAAATAEPVAHVMPTWTPTVAAPEPEPPPSATPEVTVAAGPGIKQARRKTGAAVRRVADPFDANDDGANCFRCGYAIEPARERRGLMTCGACG